jgi:hypothetical protein
MECKNPGERDEEGKLPYTADKLCAPDERKKRTLGAWSSSDAMSANQGQGPSSSKRDSEKSGQPPMKESVLGKQDDRYVDISSPAKKKQPQSQAKPGRGGKTQARGNGPQKEDANTLMGQKRKTQQVYRVKSPTVAEE